MKTYYAVIMKVNEDDNYEEIVSIHTTPIAALNAVVANHIRQLDPYTGTPMNNYDFQVKEIKI